MIPLFVSGLTQIKFAFIPCIYALFSVELHLMQSVTQKIEAKYKKHQIVDVHSGDTVRVHQKIKEGSKERVQVFEGVVIKTNRGNSHTASITVRRVSSGIGVEKSYMLHSPLIVKVEIVKRSKVRRNYLSYMRKLTGKSARLSSVAFDKNAVNTVAEAPKAKEEAPQESKKADTPAAQNSH